MTQYFSFALNFPPEIDPFPADFAGHATALIAREFFGGQVHGDPLGGEKIVVGNLSICQHLLLIFVGNFRMYLPRECLRGFLRSHTDRFPSVDIYKSSRNLAPVTEFQGTFSQPASGDHCNCICRAAVDLDEGYQALAIFSVRVIDCEFSQSEHRKPHPKHLSGTDVAVRLFSIAKIFFEGFHKAAFNCQLSA